MFKLQDTEDTFCDDGFTTTCAPTLAAEGRPKSKARAVLCGFTVAAGFVFVPPVLPDGSVGAPAVGLGVTVGVSAAVGVTVGNAGAVISVGVAVGAGLGVAVGVGVIVGVTSITAVGSGSFCLLALQDTASTMIPITNNKHKPPAIRSLVRLSNCSI